MLISCFFVVFFVFTNLGSYRIKRCDQIIKSAIASGKRYTFDFLFKHGVQNAYVPLKSVCFALYDIDLTTSAGDIMSFINNLYNSYLPQNVNSQHCKGVIVIATPNLQASFKLFDHTESHELDQDPTITAIATSRPHDMEDTMILTSSTIPIDLEDNSTQTQNLNVFNDSSQNLWLRRKAKEMGVDPAQYVDMNMSLDLANGTFPISNGALPATDLLGFRLDSEGPHSTLTNVSSLPSAQIADFSPLTSIPSSVASVPPSAFAHFSFHNQTSANPSTSSSPSVNYNIPFAPGPLDDLSAVNAPPQRQVTTAVTSFQSPMAAAEMAAARAVAIANGSAMTQGQTAPAAVGSQGFDFGLENLNHQTLQASTFAPPTFPYLPSSTPPATSRSHHSSISSASSFNSASVNPKTINPPGSPSQACQATHRDSISSSGSSSSSNPNVANTQFWNPGFTGSEKVRTLGSESQKQQPVSTSDAIQQQQLQFMTSMGIQHPSQMTAQQQQQLYSSLIQTQQLHAQPNVHPMGVQFQGQQQMAMAASQKRVLSLQGMSNAGMSMVPFPMNVNILPGMNGITPVNMNNFQGINVMNMNQFYTANGGPQPTAITTDAIGFMSTASLASGAPYASMVPGPANAAVAAAMRNTNPKRKGRYGLVPAPGGSSGATQGRNGRGNNSNGHVCAECHVEESPEWRKGPKGPKTLCNACGLRWAKKSRKESQKAAAAAAAAATTTSILASSGSDIKNEANTVTNIKTEDTKEDFDALIEASSSFRSKSRVNSVSSINSLSSTDSKGPEDMIISTPNNRKDNEKRHYMLHGNSFYNHHQQQQQMQNYHYGGSGGGNLRQNKTSVPFMSMKGDFSISKSKNQGSMSTAAIPASAVIGATSASASNSCASSTVNSASSSRSNSIVSLNGIKMEPSDL